jgi:hypothetical protein
VVSDTLSRDSNASRVRQIPVNYCEATQYLTLPASELAYLCIRVTLNCAFLLVTY